ncbi:MAG: glutaredoxin family protein [Candidatus Dormibacteraceae bacterium]
MRVYTTTWCGDCKMAKKVLEDAGVDFEEIDLDRDPAAVPTVLAINGGYRTVPTILFPDGRVLVEPSRRELRAALGLAQDPTLLDRVSKVLHPHR